MARQHIYHQQIQAGTLLNALGDSSFHPHSLQHSFLDPIFGPFWLANGADTFMIVNTEFLPVLAADGRMPATAQAVMASIWSADYDSSHA